MPTLMQGGPCEDHVDIITVAPNLFFYDCYLFSCGKVLEFTSALVKSRSTSMIPSLFFEVLIMIIISDVLLASVWLYMCHESDTILSTECMASVQSHSRYFICEKTELKENVQCSCLMAELEFVTRQVVLTRMCALRMEAVSYKRVSPPL